MDNVEDLHGMENRHAQREWGTLPGTSWQPPCAKKCARTHNVGLMASYNLINVKNRNSFYCLLLCKEEYQTLCYLSSLFGGNFYGRLPFRREVDKRSCFSLVDRRGKTIWSVIFVRFALKLRMYSNKMTKSGKVCDCVRIY